MECRNHVQDFWSCKISMAFHPGASILPDDFMKSVLGILKHSCLDHRIECKSHMKFWIKTSNVTWGFIYFWQRWEALLGKPGGPTPLALCCSAHTELYSVPQTDSSNAQTEWWNSNRIVEPFCVPSQPVSCPVTWIPPICPYLTSDIISSPQRLTWPLKSVYVCPIIVVSHSTLHFSVL